MTMIQVCLITRGCKVGSPIGCIHYKILAKTLSVSGIISSNEYNVYSGGSATKVIPFLVGDIIFN